MKKTLLFLYITVLFLGAKAQTTVGLLLNTAESFNGYTLFAPNQSDITYLIDNCGFVVNQWQSEQVPELSVYLLEDGSLLRASYGNLYRYSWEGDLIWSFDLHQLGIFNHHDIEPLPNGNILIIATEDHGIVEAIERGRNPNTLENSVETDWIAEIQPIGNDQAELVWAWRSWDHLVQDFDADKQGFGSIVDNPQLLDINLNYTFDDLFGMGDWMHCNGVDYNADLDQIVFSSRHFSEIFIIDHSTTMEEAATNQGGNAGKGGNLLWRWGNPENYNSGNAEDRKLFGQHDPKWIPAGYPDEGKISVFNNGYQRDGEYSSIHLIDPPLLADGNYSLNNGSFLPNDYAWSWQGEVFSELFFGPVESGVNMLPNGNFLVCEVFGRFFEVTTEGNVVWVYRCPVGQQIINQYDIDWTDVFRAERYAPDYAAFANRDLTPGNYIENLNPVSDNCNTFEVVGLADENIIIEISVSPNPARQNIEIISKWLNVEYKIYNNLGKLVLISEANKIDVSLLTAGIYLVELLDRETTKRGICKLIIQ